MPSLINSDDGVVSGSAGLKTTGGNDGILALQNNGTTNVTVTAAGNVGIGTSSPAASLSVTKQTTALSGTGNPYGAYLYPTSSGQCFLDAVTSGSSNTSMGIRSYNNGTYYSANLDNSGNFQFNSGYGSTATAYGCRAWVNFDGTSNTANLSGTYSQSGTTVTVTATAHGLIAGNAVYSLIGTGTAVSGTYTVVTVISSSQFTYTAGTSLTTSGNVTLRRSTIRASGNVSSVADNGTSDYTVNFTTAMPDANYAAVGITGSTAGGSAQMLTPGAAQTTSSCRVVAWVWNASQVDPSYVSVAIFR